MKIKKIFCTLLTMTLILSSSMPVFAVDKSVSPVDKSVSPNESNTKIQLATNHKTKKAPAPAKLKKGSLDVSLMEDDDSDYDWHYTWDMSGGVVSTHFQEGTVSVICACLAARFGGDYNDYYAAACGIAGWAATESSSDVWEMTDYYWTANPDYSSEFPYYIKQVIRYYGDAECNNYIDTSVRYYYSDMTF